MRSKVQGLGSGRLVSTGEWWGSGDRLWSLMKSWYILSAMYLFVLVRSWAEVVAFMSPMLRGTVFAFIYNGCYLCLHLKAGGLCFSLPKGQ